jgi:hypothetical protein
MLWILIPAVCAVLALLGLALCRIAGLSDAADAARLAEWSRADDSVEPVDLPAATPQEQIPADSHYGSYRATG